MLAVAGGKRVSDPAEMVAGVQEAHVPGPVRRPGAARRGGSACREGCGMAADGLPDEGELRLGPVTLPAGRLVHAGGEAIAWATNQAVTDAGHVWAILSGLHPGTGLVPFLLEGLSADPGRPWDSGEFSIPADPAGADGLDALRPVRRAAGGHGAALVGRPVRRPAAAGGLRRDQPAGIPAAAQHRARPACRLRAFRVLRRVRRARPT
jgi:hypothetical protein